MKITLEHKLAYISIPVLIISVVDFFYLRNIIFEKTTLTVFSALTNLVFLNAIHVIFSFFLYTRVQQFRDLYKDFHLWIVGLFIITLVIILMFADTNEVVIGVVAILHAFLQSFGLFLLCFCKKSQRNKAKFLLYTFLPLIIFCHNDLVHFSLSESYLLAGLAVFLFALLSKNLLGALFCIRFGVWLIPTQIAGYLQGAIHGVEYLILIIYLFQTTQDTFSIKEIVFMSGSLALATSYTVFVHLGFKYLPFKILFDTLVYSHYFFDTYSFRFKFHKQRNLILPLFTAKTSA